MTDYRQRTIDLRNEAWEAVKASPAYFAFQVLDDAVAKLGGERIAKSPDKATFAHARSVIDVVPRPSVAKFYGGGAVVEPSLVNRKVPHGDAAEMVLREVGEPMTGIDLVALAPKKGAVIGGEKPVANFTSTLSRDPRFRNFRKDGQYYWALTDWVEPHENEPESDDFESLLGSGSSRHSSQEGGDGHGPAQT